MLDVGCGDGLLAKYVQTLRPDISVEGIDVLVREAAHVPVRPFDGRKIPEESGAVDWVMFVDVLHHTADPMVLLREAVRVAKRGVLLKDHTRDGFAAGPTLRFMDYVGNSRHGVALPYNYWPRKQWLDSFAELGLAAAEWQDDLRLYPRPADWVFGRSLHFVARLEPSEPRS